MHKRKIPSLRCSAAVLALVIGFSAVPGMIKTADAAGSDTNKAVRLLTGLGIMNRDKYNGLFWDDTYVKRSEMAEIICSIFKLEVKAENAPVFTDVSDSDRAYVETAVRSGYMNGYGDGRFGANDYITCGQLVKTFVCMIGAQPYAEALGGYPQGYIQAAKTADILSGVSNGADSIARRIDVANIIYNTLHADIYEIQGFTQGSAELGKTDGKTFLTEVLDIYKDEGIMTANSYTALNRVTELGSDYISIGDNIYTDPNHLTDEYLGCSVTVYYSAPEDEIGEIVYIEEKHNNKIIEVEDENIIDVSGQTFSYYDKTGSSNGKRLKFSVVADMIYNGGAVEFDAQKLKVENGRVRFIDNDGDGVYDVASVTKYNAYVAEKVNVDDETISLRYDEVPIKLANSRYRIFRNGEKAELSDIKSGDVLLVARSEKTGEKSAVSIEACSESVMGVVDSVQNDEDGSYAVINGTEYRLDEYSLKLVSRGTTEQLKSGAAGTFYLDTRGRIAAYDVSSGASGVGYLIKGFIDEIEMTLTVKVFTSKGQIEKFTAKNKVNINGSKVSVKNVLNSPSMMDCLETAQLVKYTADGDVLKNIEFAADGYDANEFSLDDAGSMTCSTATVLSDKYVVPASTVVFIVPVPVMEEAAYYNVTNGNYFVRDETNTVKLYDVNKDNTVSYAVVERDIATSNLKYNDPLLLVEKLLSAVDDEGNEVTVIKGWDETGNTVDLALNENTSADGLKAGDVIQYRSDYSGKIMDIKVLKTETTKYNLSTLASTTKYVYGEVGVMLSNRIMVSIQDELTQDMSPLDMAKSVTNNGTAVYRFSESRKKAERINFSELERGDRVFACVSGGNGTRMLVLYE